MKWITINSHDDLPKDGDQHIFDADNGEPPVWGKVEYFDKQPFLILIDSSGEEECHDLKPYYRWLDETESISQSSHADELKKEFESIERNLEKLNQHTWGTYKEQVQLHLKTCFEILSDIKPAPNPSLQEAMNKEFESIAGYMRKINRDNYGTYLDQIEIAVGNCKQILAGWNARDSQQTGPILTRELHDKIWMAATKRHIAEYDTKGEPEKATEPDKETFWKSLNI